MQSIEYNWLRASVDGITNDGSAVVEIKCGVSTLKKTALARQVPAYYYGQLQHILMVTGLHTIDFWCYLSDSMNFLLPVNRNEDYIKRLLEAEKKFWEQVLASKTSPV